MLFQNLCGLTQAHNSLACPHSTCESADSKKFQSFVRLLHLPKNISAAAHSVEGGRKLQFVLLTHGCACSGDAPAEIA